MDTLISDTLISNLINIKRNFRYMLNNIPIYDPLYNELTIDVKLSYINIMYYELQKINNYNYLTINTLNNLTQQFSGLLDILMLHPKKTVNNNLYIFIDMKLISLLNNINIDSEYDDTKYWFDYEIKNNYVQYFLYENIQDLPTIQYLDISIGEEIIIIIDQYLYNNIFDVNRNLNTNIRRYYLVKQIDENNLQFQIFYPHFPFQNNYKTVSTLLNDIVHKKFTIIK